MIIYKVENLINGKTYIGRTVTSLENRRWQHFHTADKNAKTIFHFAIKKYGKSNFKFSTIKTCNSIESLNKWERKTVGNIRAAEKGAN